MIFKFVLDLILTTLNKMINKYLLICCVPLLFNFTSCKPKSGEPVISPEIIDNPATANGEQKDNLPVFSFETNNHHFGEIKQGEVVDFTFKFRNTGKSDLFIVSAKASCGCTIPSYSKEPVPPGGEGKIDVQFDSHGKSGMVSKTVTVVANTMPNTKVLTVSAEILNEK